MDFVQWQGKVLSMPYDGYFGSHRTKRSILRLRRGASRNAHFLAVSSWPSSLAYTVTWAGCLSPASRMRWMSRMRLMAPTMIRPMIP